MRGGNSVILTILPNSFMRMGAQMKIQILTFPSVQHAVPSLSPLSSVLPSLKAVIRIRRLSVPLRLTAMGCWLRPRPLGVGHASGKDASGTLPSSELASVKCCETSCVTYPLPSPDSEYYAFHFQALMLAPRLLSQGPDMASSS